MKLLWHNQWMLAPDYHLPDDGVAIIVKESVPLRPLRGASGRVIRDPVRKTAAFLRTDGPKGTIAKARAKLADDRYVGDYWIALIHGDREDYRSPAVALACRVPRCAHRVVVHSLLVSTLEKTWSQPQLAAVANHLRRAALLARIGSQSYLYSAMAPPDALVTLFRDSVAQAASLVMTENAAVSVITPPARPPGASPETLLRTRARARQVATRSPVALLGAGDYARTHIIPALGRAGFSLIAVADREPQIVAQVAKRHRVPIMTTCATDAIDSLPAGGLVIVATAHDTHARLAAAALDRGLMVFVEKPPVVTETDLRCLVEGWQSAPQRLEIGFNRRYHPFSRRTREILAAESGPFTIVCTVKEIPLAPDHWYFWPNQGTRVTGNLCHWIDLGVFLMGTGRVPVDISVSPPVPPSADEERVLTVTFEDASVLIVIATNRGDEVLGVQEAIMARRGEVTVVIDDYRCLRVSRRGRTGASRARWRDKAHALMYSEALEGLVQSRPHYTARDLAVVSSIQIVASQLVSEAATPARAADHLRGLAAIAA